MSDVRTSSGPRIAKSKQPRKDRTHWLYIGVIIAVIAGIIFGLVAPSAATEFKVVGTMFVNLIKMMISPVIFCTIVWVSAPSARQHPWVKLAASR